MCRVKGLERPAVAASVPAVSVGAKGRAAAEAGQPLPLGPELTSKLAVGWASGVPGVDQGTKVGGASSNLPQVTGVISGARGPGLRFTVRWLAGSCGFSVKTVVSWPVSLSAVAMPGSLKLTP